MVERYDGKTRGDDIKKWILRLGIPVGLLLIISLLLNFLIPRTPEPDLSILLMDPPDVDACDRLESAVVALMTDINGDGQVRVSVAESTLTSGNLSDNMNAADLYFADPDYDLFLMPAESQFINGSDLVTGEPVYMQVDNLIKYTNAGYFDKLWDVRESKLLKDLKLHDYILGFIDWTSVGKGTQERFCAALDVAEIFAE